MSVCMYVVYEIGCLTPCKIIILKIKMSTNEFFRF